MGKKEAMVLALKKELELRKEELKEELVETVYFGGGTPSVLTSEEINSIIASVYENYRISENPEITLEANPDDLSKELIVELSNSAINRLSIGVQSFFAEDLKLMNRAHNSQEAEECIREATKYFDNISIDLIYGIPGMTNERWIQNIEIALALDVPHISSYVLTVEPKTALFDFIKKGTVIPIADEVAQEHFNTLQDEMEKAGYESYEISSFGKPGYFSRNNMAYWRQKKYIGIGPSAHSYDGVRRGWNINNNPKYIKSIANNEVPIEIEVLSTTDNYNEYVMTGLRTIWGVSLDKITSEFGEKYHSYLLKQADRYLKEGLLYTDDSTLISTHKGRFLVDGIAADLFMLN
jgi:oxygen-independent coproporphyrinogen-3 oxidase